MSAGAEQRLGKLGTKGRDVEAEESLGARADPCVAAGRFLARWIVPTDDDARSSLIAARFLFAASPVADLDPAGGRRELHAIPRAAVLEATAWQAEPAGCIDLIAGA